MKTTKEQELTAKQQPLRAKFLWQTLPQAVSGHCGELVTAVEALGQRVPWRLIGWISRVLGTQEALRYRRGNTPGQPEGSGKPSFTVDVQVIRLSDIPKHPRPILSGPADRNPIANRHGH